MNIPSLAARACLDARSKIPHGVRVKISPIYVLHVSFSRTQDTLRNYPAYNSISCILVCELEFEYTNSKDRQALYTRYPIVARALGLAAFRPSASREQRYLAYKGKRVLSICEQSPL